MSKRKYTNIKEIESKILTLRNLGATNQEIANTFGLELKQIKNWVNRYNRNQARIAAGVLSPKPVRRPNVPKESIAYYKYENQMLRMENKLLRDFLKSTGRK